MPPKHTLQAVAALQGREPDYAVLAADTLADFLGLKAVGLSITGARIVGRGGRASADLYLSSGDVITFESLADFANARKLNVEMRAWVTGAAPKLDGKTALEALVLLRKIAELEETVTDDQIGVEWGMGVLQTYPVVDVDMSDGAERWGAFCKLWDRHAEEPRRYVLRDLQGARYVRCCWLMDYVRREAPHVSEKDVAHRMVRVGWTRRGKSEQGKIKATRPGFGETKIIAFYIVPAGWGEER